MGRCRYRGRVGGREYFLGVERGLGLKAGEYEWEGRLCGGRWGVL